MVSENDQENFFMVDSLSKYILAIETLTSYCGYTGDNIYRGVKDEQYDLVPKLYRKSQRLNDDFMYPIFDEDKIMGSFKRYSYPILKSKPSQDDYLQWLVLAQHYGVPTRLLDFTTNPMVALYFAVEDINLCNDGAVWLLNLLLYNKFFELNNIVPNIEKRTSSGSVKNKSNLLPELIKPYYYDDRMENQSSRFIIFNLSVSPLNKENNVIVNSLKEYTVMEYQNNLCERHFNPGENCFLSKIFIKSTAKDRLLKELNLIGINEMFIYRSLDNIGRYIDEQLSHIKFYQSSDAYNEFLSSSKE